jgi:hypothetical protein
MPSLGKVTIKASSEKRERFNRLGLRRKFAPRTNGVRFLAY